MDFEIINSLLVIFVFIATQYSSTGKKKIETKKDEILASIIEKQEEHEQRIKELEQRN